MMEAMPHWGSDSFMEGYTVGPNGENYENLKNSEVVVITAGLARMR